MALPGNSVEVCAKLLLEINSAKVVIKMDLSTEWVGSELAGFLEKGIEFCLFMEVSLVSSLEH